MPVPFQAGLFCTVLALAAVRFLRSLREVARSGRGGRPDAGSSRDASRRGRGESIARGPGEASPAGEPPGGEPPGGEPQRGAPVAKGPGATGAPDSTSGALMRRPLATGGQSRFRWDRWYHLAILWGVVLLCGPFLFGLALPGHMRELSLALDLGRAALAPDLSSRYHRMARRPSGLALPAIRERSGFEDRGLNEMLLAIGAAVAACVLASGLAAGRRYRRAMSALALAGVVAACAGLALAGPAASRLSGAVSARDAIEAYASAPAVPAEEAHRFAGPVRLVGRPLLGTSAGTEYLYLRGPREVDGGASAVYAGFRLGAAAVSPSSPAECRLVRPHVRLGARGREYFLRADEEVVVMGFLLDDVLGPRPGYPLVVAPAGAGPPPASRGEQGGGRKVFEALAADLLGTVPARTRRLALLQVALGSALAWFLTVLAASGTERVLGGRRKEGPPPARPNRNG